MTNEDLELLKREAGKAPTTQTQEFLLDLENRQRKSNKISLIFTVIGAIGSVVAAITGLVLLFQ